MNTTTLANEQAAFLYSIVSYEAMIDSLPEASTSGTEEEIDDDEVEDDEDEEDDGDEEIDEAPSEPPVDETDNALE